MADQKWMQGAELPKQPCIALRRYPDGKERFAMFSGTHWGPAAKSPKEARNAMRNGGAFYRSQYQELSWLAVRY